VNTPALLFNNAVAGIEATVNKAAAGNYAAFAFKTGFSARALIGLLGNDDFSFKVSPDGSAFFEALKIDRLSGRVELPEPIVMPGLASVPAPPPAGKLALYARDRAGAGWLDVQRPSSRFFPLQPHFGVNRIATWPHPRAPRSTPMACRAPLWEPSRRRICPRRTFPQASAAGAWPVPPPPMRRRRNALQARSVGAAMRMGWAAGPR
ncbi:hypothetical protein, partial [Novosphingobium sp.]|uniref:hypothetical protein n=1 Tax=Novosphingobium sp. TaxID=1874826 RepID=UPI0025F38846